MGKIKLNQLEVLVTVTDAGSFSAAAVELGCTQSRISHAIAELEQSIGVRLLNRSRLGCVPTEAGHRVLAKARQILRIADSVIPSAQEDSEVVGQVRLACFRSIATHLLPHAMEALAREHPGIQVEIDDSCVDSLDVNRTVEEGRAEIGISSFQIGKHLVQHAYLHDAYVLLMPTAFKLRGAISWEQLEGMSYIESISISSNLAYEQCRRAGFKAVPSRRLVNESGILFFDFATAHRLSGAGGRQYHCAADSAEAPFCANRRGGNRAHQDRENPAPLFARQARHQANRRISIGFCRV